MGTWSPKIFDNDGAEDIISEYKILLGYGIPPLEAYKKIKEYFYPDYQGDCDEDVYWLAIALYQWQNGILLDEVKENAIKCLEEGSYLEQWEECGEKVYQKRKEILEQFHYKLLNEINPVKKRFPKCSSYYRRKTNWDVGDLLVFKTDAPILEWGENVKLEIKRKLQESQKYITNQYLLFRVVEISKTPVSLICPELDYSSCPVVMLYDWVNDSLPTDEEIENLEYKPIVTDYWSEKKKIVSSVCLYLDVSKEDARWGKFTLLKKDINYVIPDMYVLHPGTPMEFLSSLHTKLIFTFALEEDNKIEWYSDKHFFERQEQ